MLHKTKNLIYIQYIQMLQRILQILRSLGSAVVSPWNCAHFVAKFSIDQEITSITYQAAFKEFRNAIIMHRHCVSGLRRLQSNPGTLHHIWKEEMP